MDRSEVLREELRIGCEDRCVDSRLQHPRGTTDSGCTPDLSKPMTPSLIPAQRTNGRRETTILNTCRSPMRISTPAWFSPVSAFPFSQCGVNLYLEVPKTRRGPSPLNLRRNPAYVNQIFRPVCSLRSAPPSPPALQSVNTSIVHVAISFATLGMLFYVSTVVSRTSAYEWLFQTPALIVSWHLRDSAAT